MIDKTNRILILGGTGFLGKHIINELNTRNYNNIISFGKMDVDLRNYDETKRALNEVNPNIVIYASAYCGGIGANSKDPVGFLENNAYMNLNVVKSCSDLNLIKFVGIGSVCSFPRNCPTPFKEEDIFKGRSEPTNFYYGFSKLLLLSHIEAYRKQYNFPGIFLIPVNMYGEEDSFDDNKSHVIPAIIKRIYQLKKEGKKELICWGSGKASREFLYVKDAARGIIDGMEKYNKLDPINIGNGVEIKIKKLVKLIAELMNFDGKIIWDKSKPDGQPRRQLDVSKAKKEFGFKANVDLKSGLKDTIKWFIEKHG